VEGVDWMHPAHNWDQWWAGEYMVMDFRVP
jgi:hypothetical protein